jgi:hypothetical protein
MYEADPNWDGRSHLLGKRKRTPNYKKDPTNFQEWLEDPDKVLRHMEKYNLHKMIEKNDGIVKISNFLPTWVADGALNMIENIKDEDWNKTEANHDKTHNNIEHKFWSTKNAE